MCLDPYYKEPLLFMAPSQKYALAQVYKLVRDLDNLRLRRTPLFPAPTQGNEISNANAVVLLGGLNGMLSYQNQQCLDKNSAS